MYTLTVLEARNLIDPNYIPIIFYILIKNSGMPFQSLLNVSINLSWFVSINLSDFVNMGKENIIISSFL